ncbi:MAG: transcriptional regulator [Pirellulaceae bacterium]|nr:transcriptional regulator [Pirellulaceae bacterium]
MTTENTRLNNKTQELPKDVIELAALIAALPTEQRTAIEPVLNRVVESTKRRRRILNLVQEALSQLRLDMKYLVFDLEATRRERDTYRQAIEEAEGGEQDSTE